MIISLLQFHKHLLNLVCIDHLNYKVIYALLTSVSDIYCVYLFPYFTCCCVCGVGIDSVCQYGGGG